MTYLRRSTGLGRGKTDAENGIGAELLLVGAAVRVVQQLVDGGLVLDVEAGLDEGRAQDVVDVGDGLGHAFAAPLGLVLVAQLVGLVLALGVGSLPARLVPWISKLTSGCTGGYDGAVQARVGDHVHLDGGVAARVIDLAGVDLLDRHDW